MIDKAISWFRDRNKRYSLIDDYVVHVEKVALKSLVAWKDFLEETKDYPNDVIAKEGVVKSIEKIMEEIEDV
jgi:hypothetical protein